MATSRTGTAKWKNLRAKALARGKAEGQDRCPICRGELDWSRSLQPSSPEADHIIPVILGGTDTLDNLRIICRTCNQRLGVIAREQKRVELKQQRKAKAFTGTLSTSQSW